MKMRRLELLDVLRLGAALSVLCFHYFYNGIHNGKVANLDYVSGLVSIAKYGYLGVELFFMISGYVIFYSANQRGPGDFLASRAQRLYPAFWISMLVTATAAHWLGGTQMQVTARQVLANLTMFPGLLGEGPVDGVYWTLALEWKFYACVFVISLLGLRSALGKFALMWPVYMWVSQAVPQWSLPLSGGYYAYFATGAVFAVRHSGESRYTAIPIALCASLSLQFSAGPRPEISLVPGDALSRPLIAAIILAFFGLFFLLGHPKVHDLRLPGSRLAGALSYPVYLIHAHLGYMLLSAYGSRNHLFISYAATVAVVLAIAWLVHEFIERRLAPVWKRLFQQTVGTVGRWAKQGLLAARRGG